MKQKEWRFVNIYYCDHCHKQCPPAPAMRIGGKWFGDCCVKEARKEFSLNTPDYYEGARPLLPYEDIS